MTYGRITGVHDTHEWIVLCIMWCDLGSSIADADLHRVNRVSEWRPVSDMLQEMICLPRSLTDVIAIYVLDVRFYVRVVNINPSVKKIQVVSGREIAIMNDFYIRFVECDSESLEEGYVSYFGTMKEFAAADLYNINDYTVYVYDPLKIEYYLDQYGKVRLEESVRLFDLCVPADGYRIVYRRVWLA